MEHDTKGASDKFLVLKIIENCNNIQHLIAPRKVATYRPQKCELQQVNPIIQANSNRLGFELSFLLRKIAAMAKRANFLMAGKEKEHTGERLQLYYMHEKPLCSKMQ